MRRLQTTLTLLLAVALLAPGAALASASSDYLDVYKAFAAKGTIDGCAFTAKKLASAKKGVPPDIDTYAPDFPDALDAALSRRASGACDKPASTTKKKSPASTAPATTKPGPGQIATDTGTTDGVAATGATASGATGTSGATGAAAATTTPAPPPDITAAPAAADGSVATAASRNASATTAKDAPFPLVLLAVLAGPAALAALAWALARFLALDPPWFAAGRHATSEAGWRASASWAEFTDWLRLGR